MDQQRPNTKKATANAVAKTSQESRIPSTSLPPCSPLILLLLEKNLSACFAFDLRRGPVNTTFGTHFHEPAKEND